MAGDPNIYDALERAIATERRRLPSSGDISDRATWPKDEQERLAELANQHASVNAHRWMAVQTVAASEPSSCQACGEARPCATIRELANAYGVHGEGEHSGAPAEEVSRNAVQSDQTGECACGLYGRQFHMRVTRPGEEPEIWVRSKFVCAPTRPGPHYRLY